MLPQGAMAASPSDGPGASPYPAAPWAGFCGLGKALWPPTPGDTVPVDIASGSALLAPPVTHKQRQMCLPRGSVARPTILFIMWPSAEMFSVVSGQRDPCADSGTSMSEKRLVWARALGVCTGPWEDGACQVGPVPTPGCSTLHGALPAFSPRDLSILSHRGVPYCLLEPGTLSGYPHPWPTPSVCTFTNLPALTHGK